MKQRITYLDTTKALLILVINRFCPFLIGKPRKNT